MVVRSRLRANTINRDDEVECVATVTGAQLVDCRGVPVCRRRDCGLNGKKTRTDNWADSAGCHLQLRPK